MKSSCTWRFNVMDDTSSDNGLGFEVGADMLAELRLEFDDLRDRSELKNPFFFESEKLEML